MDKNMNFLMDLERTFNFNKPFFWKPNKFGYTNFLNEAGLYSDKEAEEIKGQDFEGRTVIVPLSVVKGILK